MVHQISNPFEETLAYHCAPVLMNAKSANLVSFSKEKHPQLLTELQEYNLALGYGDLHFEYLCECNSRILVLVYRRTLLERELSAPGVTAFLKTCGYPLRSTVTAATMTATAMADVFQIWIAHLKERMVSCHGFPHEIGLFLGYPLTDVLGFIENQGRDYLLSGYWKVYSDAEHCKKTFATYTACRDFLCTRISNGDRLIPLLTRAA